MFIGEEWLSHGMLIPLYRIFFVFFNLKRSWIGDNSSLLKIKACDEYICSDRWSEWQSSRGIESAKEVNRPGMRALH